MADGKPGAAALDEALLVPAAEEDGGRQQQHGLAAAEVKRLVRLGGPIVASCILQNLVNMVSVMVVGHLGELPLAGASLAASLANVTGYSLLTGMATALDTLCGQAYGAGRYRRLGVYKQRAMELRVVPLLLSLLLQFLRGVSRSPGRPDAVLAGDAGGDVLMEGSGLCCVYTRSRVGLRARSRPRAGSRPRAVWSSPVFSGQVRRLLAISIFAVLEGVEGSAIASYSSNKVCSGCEFWSRRWFSPLAGHGGEERRVLILLRLRTQSPAAPAPVPASDAGIPSKQIPCRFLWWEAAGDVAGDGGALNKVRARFDSKICKVQASISLLAGRGGEEKGAVVLVFCSDWSPHACYSAGGLRLPFFFGHRGVRDVGDGVWTLSGWQWWGMVLKIPPAGNARFRDRNLCNSLSWLIWMAGFTGVLADDDEHEVVADSLGHIVNNYPCKVKQKSVATTSILDLNLGCVAIMEVVQSSGSALSMVFGGTIKASALSYHLASVEISGNATDIIEQDHTRIYCQTSCTCLSLSDGCLVEDAVFSLFGLCHRRWTTSPPLLIPRFNGGDTSSLSSVKVIPYLQLNSTPRVHFPDRPSGEPPAGHQLDRTLIEVLEDCRCGNFESGLSTDDRTPYGFICDLRHFHEFRPSCCVVQLCTYVSCSTFESHVMMYCNP